MPGARQPKARHPARGELRWSACFAKPAGADVASCVRLSGCDHDREQLATPDLGVARVVNTFCVDVDKAIVERLDPRADAP